MLQVGKLQVAVSRKKHRHFRSTQFAARNSNPSCLLCPSASAEILCASVPSSDSTVVSSIFTSRRGVQIPAETRWHCRVIARYCLPQQGPSSFSPCIEETDTLVDTCVICSRSRGCIRHSEPPMFNGELKLEWKVIGVTFDVWITSQVTATSEISGDSG